MGFILFSHIGSYIEAGKEWGKIEIEAQQANKAELQKLQDSAKTMSPHDLRTQAGMIMIKEMQASKQLQRSSEYNKFRVESMRLIALLWGIFFVFFVSLYFFNLFFLKSAPPSKGIATTPSWSGFGYFVWKSILRYLTVSIPTAFFLGLLAGGMAIFLRTPSLPVVIIFVVVGGAASYISAVLYIKFWLVSVLASDEIVSPFETSSVLEKGKIWRLFGNILMFSISAVIVFMILLNGALFAAVLLRPLIQDQSWLLTLFKTVGIMLFAGVLTSFSGLYSSLQCTAYRLLFQEHLKDNPSFTLAQRD
jgi:hypothetical protein